jgi:hypothetical protein
LPYATLVGRTSLRVGRRLDEVLELRDPSSASPVPVRRAMTGSLQVASRLPRRGFIIADDPKNFTDTAFTFLSMRQRWKKASRQQVAAEPDY